jgi:FkbM family methyltransferase
MTDTRKGFIITYFKTSEQGQKLLEDLVDTIAQEDYYLILASHSPVPVEIQKKCDFYIFEEQNIIDDRKYSHGVAENVLTQMALQHLKYKKIEWTYKVTYDVIIKDVSRFDDWVQDYRYDFVSCMWGSNIMCTNSFFANVDFILDNIVFYHTIEEMFAVNNVLENCWEKNIRDKGLTDRLYSYPDKNTFFGPHNKIDNLFYNYNEIEFWYSAEENRFYIKNNGEDLNCNLRIFDYYTDLCVYLSNGWAQQKDMTFWIVPPAEHYIPGSKNGHYLELYIGDQVIRKNFNIKDFNYKDPLHKKFRFNKDKEVKFNEYSEFEDLGIYKEFGININEIKNFIDVGSCYGFASLPFIRKGIKTYMVEADTGNAKILERAFGNTPKIKVISKAVCNIDGTVDFFIDNNFSVTSSLSEGDAFSGTENRTKVTVPAITPNTLIEKYVDEQSIDLMKVDIEGTEYDFFKVITDENIEKVKKFIIEFHKNDNYEVLGILEKLAKNNFKYKLYNWGCYTNEYIIENKMGIIYAWR